MDETKLIQSAGGLVSDLLSRHGIEGIIGFWLIYEKWIRPWRKKGNEEWISWRDVKFVKERQEALETKINLHLEKEAEEDIRLAKMEVKMDAIDDKIKTENAHIFNQLKSIHESLSELMKHYGSNHSE